MENNIKNIRKSSNTKIIIVSEERGILEKDIKEYLKLISYTIARKEQKALFIFLKKAHQLQ